MLSKQKKKEGIDPEDHSIAMDQAFKQAIANQEALEARLQHMGDTITALNCRIALRNEMIVGYFEKHFEDCRRIMRIYNKPTVEYKVQKLLLDKMMDVRRDILNS